MNFNGDMVFLVAVIVGNIIGTIVVRLCDLAWIEMFRKEHAYIFRLVPSQHFGTHC